ncbi:hypothetical protein R1sor_011334 [Riccia sorocarpa]|uniref:Uncharacterized protein n=1 Tax=Riccia sorocarpa TaxID=122646 RepID=A0ABD3I0L7_9MARC
MLDVSLPVCRAGGTNVAGGTVYGREETPTDGGHGYENLFEETTAAEEELDGDDNQTATEILAAHTCSAAPDVATDHFTFEGETMSFDEAVQEKVFRVLALLDEHRCSLAMQNSLLHILFANIHKDPISVVPNWVNLQLRQAPSNHHELSLARLMTLAGSNWKGGDKGECTPASLARTAETFQHRGLVDPQKWDMCIGDGSFTHGPVLYGPNNLQTTCENNDENADVFKFPCETCADEVSGSPVYVKGEPFNVALMGHWDGFRAATSYNGTEGLLDCRNSYFECWENSPA